MKTRSKHSGRKHSGRKLKRNTKVRHNKTRRRVIMRGGVNITDVSDNYKSGVIAEANKKYTEALANYLIDKTGRAFVATAEMYETGKQVSDMTADQKKKQIDANYIKAAILKEARALFKRGEANELLSNTDKAIAFYRAAGEQYKTNINSINNDLEETAEVALTDTGRDVIISANKPNNPKGLYELGERYYYGNGLAKNYKVAFSYFKDAADKQIMNEGNKEYIVKAMEKVALMYSKGWGVVINPVNSLEYYEKAYKNDSILAITKLATIYNNGIGVEKDIEKAKKYNMEASNEGFPIGTYNLGMNLFAEEQAKENRGEPSNYATALGLIFRAARKGLTLAYYDLGNIYSQGDFGQTIDTDKALKYYKIAATKIYNDTQKIETLLKNKILQASNVDNFGFSPPAVDVPEENMDDQEGAEDVFETTFPIWDEPQPPGLDVSPPPGWGDFNEGGKRRTRKRKQHRKKGTLSSWNKFKSTATSRA